MHIKDIKYFGLTNCNLVWRLLLRQNIFATIIIMGFDDGAFGAKVLFCLGVCLYSGAMMTIG